MTNERSTSRRDFLKPPKSTDEGTSADLSLPVAGNTVRVSTRAMACEFSVILNAGSHEQVTMVGDVLELIHDIEGWLSIYKPDSEISRVNRAAGSGSLGVEKRLFNLLQLARRLFEQTDGAFDVAAGTQIRLWRECRSQQRIPTDQEIAAVLQRSGTQHLRLNEDDCTVEFAAEGLELDPGAIGKGFALDEAADWLSRAETGPNSFLIHGGHSSLIARGEHNLQPGWPVGIGNPLFTKKRLGTVLLRDRAMSTSGSNIQFFRQDGRRYGHILDPRTAVPADGMLSVTVFAESAAVADALSTAFFVLGVENARKCCDNLPEVGAILIPFPDKGKRVAPTMIGVPDDWIFWDEEQVALNSAS